MKLKRMIILSLLLFGILLIGSVNAADNNTTETISIENNIDDFNIKEDYNLELKDSNYQTVDDFTDEYEILTSSYDDNQISAEDSDDVLSNIPSNAYYVSKIGSIGSTNGVTGFAVYLKFNSTSKYSDYKYSFYFTLHAGSVSSPLYISEKYTGEFVKENGEYKTIYRRCTVDRTLGPGNYRITIRNSEDGKILGTKNCTVMADLPPWGAYKLNITCGDITYESGGKITINYLTYAPNYYKYKFAYRISIYNPDTKRSILNKYINSTYNAKSTTIDVKPYCSPGRYHVTIFNCKEEYVMKDFYLNIYSEQKYSINVSPINITQETGGKINLTLPSTVEYNKYNFYLKIYDSNNTLKIDKRYSGISPKRINIEHVINPNELYSGKYRLELIRAGDEYVFQNITFDVPNEINVKQNTSDSDIKENSSTKENTSSTTPSTQKDTPKKNKISLSLKTVNVKKSAKKLVLQVTLKQGKTPLKNKKITFKFNGKKYSAKTNSKGIAKVTIKKTVLKKLKIGKKIKYQAIYGKLTVTKAVKVKK
ncbi:hypothetical protein [uncultured Methanobrevibacter sp.]|uniref:hypothetical protein n=1 Tax=uncultured Methanobrevibacter sp. TaxID=253161 RepID=UPI0025DAD080|nr:hypothetical protein [uncultured Methanobrevibacter sp.]